MRSGSQSMRLGNFKIRGSIGKSYLKTTFVDVIVCKSVMSSRCYSKQRKLIRNLLLAGGVFVP